MINSEQSSNLDIADEGVEFSITDFLYKLSKLPPQPPHSLSIVGNMTPDEIKLSFQNLLMFLCENRYKCPPSKLTDTEFEEARRYYQSMGFDISREKTTSIQRRARPNLDGSITWLKIPVSSHAFDFGTFKGTVKQCTAANATGVM